MGMLLKYEYSGILNNDSMNTGRKKSDMIPCRCFFQKFYLINYLHHFFDYLLGDFLLNINIINKIIDNIINIK